MQRLQNAFVWCAGVVLTASLAGCPGATPEDGGAPNDGGAVTDGGGATDSGTPLDAGAPTDSGTPLDAGTPTDSGSPLDAGTPTDSGSPLDAGTPTDGGAEPACDPLLCDGACQTIPTGGDRVFCVQGTPRFVNMCPADAGTVPEEFDECCDDSDCAAVGGAPSFCAAGRDVCSGVPPPFNQNTCRAQECVVDTDCTAGSVCVPEGALGLLVNTCVVASCRADADCTAGAQGRCDVYGSTSPCGLPLTFSCSYATDACGAAAGNPACPPASEPSVCYPKTDRSGVECVELGPPPP